LATSRGTVDRDADIRHMQRRSVVNAVAKKADCLAHPLQRHDHAQLLLRCHAAEQARFAKTTGQGILAQCSLISGPVMSLPGSKPSFSAEMLRDLLVVSGQDLHSHACGRERG